MPFNSFIDTEGLINLVNTVNFIGSMFKMGLEHKLTDNDKAVNLKKIAEKINPDGIKEIAGINAFLTPLNVTQLNSNINNFNLIKILDFWALLTDERIVALNNYIKPTNSDPSLSVFSPILAVTITNSGSMELVLNLITSANFYELVRVSNLLVYFDTLGILTNVNLDKFTHSLTGKDLDDVNADLPTLTTEMPNFSNYSAILNSSNLSSLVVSPNRSCSPCLVSFLDISGLKIDIMSFLNSAFDPLSFFSSKLNGLFDSVGQYNHILDLAILDLNQFDIFSGSLNSLIASIELAITNIPLMAECTPALFLLGMLKALQLGLNAFLIIPLQNQIASLKLNIGSYNSFLNSMKSLENLIPHIDC